MLLQKQRNQHQLPLIQKAQASLPASFVSAEAALTARRKQPSEAGGCVGGGGTCVNTPWGERRDSDKLESHSRLRAHSCHLRALMRTHVCVSWRYFAPTASGLCAGYSSIRPRISGWTFCLC